MEVQKKYLIILRAIGQKTSSTRSWYRLKVFNSLKLIGVQPFFQFKRGVGCTFLFIAIFSTYKYMERHIKILIRKNYKILHVNRFSLIKEKTLHPGKSVV